jgi:hypothetical protein
VPQALVFGVMVGERHAPMPCGASAIGAHELQTRLGCAALGQSFQRAEIARPIFLADSEVSAITSIVAARMASSSLPKIAKKS